METIKVYLDTMFASLPKTQEVMRLKQDLQLSLEDKYNELMLEGKPQHEALGIVISEFGNIEELAKELGIPLQPSYEPMFANEIPFEGSQSSLYLSSYEIDDFVAAKRQIGFNIGLGVLCCIVSVAFLIVMSGWADSFLGRASKYHELVETFGIIGMFVFVAIGVALFIYSGSKMKSFERLKNGFSLTQDIRNYVIHLKERFAPTYRFSLVTGIGLCIVSSGFVILGDVMGGFFSELGVALFFIAIALGVFFFVYYGNIQGAYTYLLEESEK